MSLLSRFTLGYIPLHCLPTVFDNYSTADAVLIGFGVENPDSLEDVRQKLMEEIRENCCNDPVIIVGLKKDVRVSRLAFDETNQTRFERLRLPASGECPAEDVENDFFDHRPQLLPDDRGKIVDARSFPRVRCPDGAFHLVHGQRRRRQGIWYTDRIRCVHHLSDWWKEGRHQRRRNSLIRVYHSFPQFQLWDGGKCRRRVWLEVAGGLPDVLSILEKSVPMLFLLRPQAPVEFTSHF